MGSQVILPLGLHMRVDCYLGDYLSQKSGRTESFQDNAFSRSNSCCSIATDDGIFEQPEPLPQSKAAMEKIFWRRSVQMRSQQQAWQAYEGWNNAEKDLAGYEYCWKNFLSAQSMKAIDALRREFYSLLKDTELVDSTTTTCNSWSYDVHLPRVVICYGLYPGICSVVHNEKSFSLKTMEDGQVLLYYNSVNAKESKIPYPWLVFNEKIKVNSIFLWGSTAVSDSVLLLFGGNISMGDTDGHLKMLGGYLELFMKPAIAEMYRSLRSELED